MRKLIESEETLNAIRTKALNNAKQLGTYKTRAHFKLGKDFQTFTDLCHRLSQGL